MVGIKDFEMPHNCDSCPFFMGENTHCTVGCFVPYGYDDYGEKRLKDCPLVEVAPKDQYEARLKADLMAMLTEIQLEIDEEFKTNIDGSFPLDGGYNNAYNNGLGMANQILKSKIDKLKENKDGSN